MFVLMAAAEVAPYARTGGLGDVLGALPRFLKRRGVDVAVVMPGYRCVRRGNVAWEPTEWDVQVPISDRWVSAPVWRTEMRDGVPVYAIMADQYFDRAELYGEGGQAYTDNAERFAFFSRAVLDLVSALGVPDILHAHDWHAALVPAFLRADSARYPWGSSVRTVLTIHNLAYQGSFWPLDWHLLCLDHRYFSFDAFEAWGNINYLKAGIMFADWLTTVSPTYAQEIQRPEYGCGLDGALRYRAARLTGILNGVDYEEWDPSSDPALPRPFRVDDLGGRVAVKASVQREFGWTADPNTPLLGTVSRLVAEKGMALLADIAPELLRRGVQLAVLGKGNPQWERTWAELASRHRDRMGVALRFDQTLAKRMYGGCDLFLMPSQFEPCGLAQMYAMRYGAVPVVHATGGLEDSVVDADEHPDAGTGFKFRPWTADRFLEAIDRALRAYHEAARWQGIVQKAMRADFSWSRSAAQYHDLYTRALGAKPST